MLVPSIPMHSQSVNTFKFDLTIEASLPERLVLKPEIKLLDFSFISIFEISIIILVITRKIKRIRRKSGKNRQ